MCRRSFRVVVVVGYCLALLWPAFEQASAQNFEQVYLQKVKPTQKKRQKYLDELHSKNKSIRVAAIDALGQMGSYASPAVPALIGLLKDYADISNLP